MKLEKFLVLAKQNTYASGAEGIETILPDGSKELLYHAENFRYRDRYFGARDFLGREVVWQNETPVWGMNYYGFLVSDAFPSGQFSLFLRKALRQVAEERPFRGPGYLIEEEFEYLNESQGTVERFTGLERILYQRREIYRLVYHGGAVIP